MRLTCNDNEQALLDAFLRAWPLDKVKRMTLDEYTKFGSRNSFTYLLEFGGTPLSLGGGRAYKFGIYAHNPEHADEELTNPSHKRDATYSWKASNGNTAQEAFLKARQVIVEIIEAVRRGELVHMDKAVVGGTVARKIAYLYQDSNRPTIIGYFRDELLKAYLDGLDVQTDNMSLEALHQEVIRRAKPTDDLQSLGTVIYREQQAGEVAESDDNDTDATTNYRLWHYNLSRGNYLADGLNDLKTLLSKSEINMRLDCGDLSGVPIDEDAGKAAATQLMKPADEETTPSTSGLMGWWFSKLMKEGDLVFARIDENLFIYGRITGPYRYESQRNRCRHARDIEWIVIEPRRVNWKFAKPGEDMTKKKLSAKELTHLPTHWANERSSLLECFGINLDNLPEITMPSTAPVSAGQPTCTIYYGPPGTGKTFKTRQHALDTCKVTYNEIDAHQRFEELRNSGQVEFVTFHQSFDYSDFVVGYKPVTEGGAMVFKPKPGVLLRIAQKARENPGKPYLLIMDEVNRGNISKIFGELITLVEPDKRKGCDFALTLTLPCPCPGYLTGEGHDQFTLPSNVHFLGTMNTADRSIALIDSALRRRFEFIELSPDPSKCPKEPIGGINVQVLLEKLNKALRKELTRDHQIGHSELMFTRQKYPQGAKPEDVANVVNKKILPQIDEWFHDSTNRKAEVLKGLARKKDKDEDAFETTVELLIKYTTKEPQG